MAPSGSEPTGEENTKQIKVNLDPKGFVIAHSLKATLKVMQMLVGETPSLMGAAVRARQPLSPCPFFRGIA